MSCGCPALQVDFGSWTGPAPEVVLAYQLYPITPIFELLVPPAWVNEAYPELLRQVGWLLLPRLAGWLALLRLMAPA